MSWSRRGGSGSNGLESYDGAGKKRGDDVSQSPRLVSESDRVITPLPSRATGGISSGSPKANKAKNAPDDPTAIVFEQSNRKRRRGDQARGCRNDGTGLRHLIHYRIVVAEVCLPSTSFTYGGQLVRIIRKSMTGEVCEGYPPP